MKEMDDQWGPLRVDNEGEITRAWMPQGYIEVGGDEAIAALYAALGKAQAAFGPVHRTKTVQVRMAAGGSYSFAYAPMEDLIAATRPALTSNGLTVLTPAVRTKSGPKVLVVVAHAGGGRIASEFCFEPQGDMKTLAGQITYLKRYGYSSMLCLSADDDADDEPAPTQSRSQSVQEPPPPNRPPLNGKPTDGQLAVYQKGIEAATELGILDLNKFPYLVADKTSADVDVLINALSVVCQEERRRLREQADKKEGVTV